MQRIFDITRKDLTQLLRNRLTFLFTLFMPAVFTLLFGFATGGFNTTDDPRLPLGFLDQDGSKQSRQLEEMLSNSRVVLLVSNPFETPASLQAKTDNGDLAAAVIVPPEFGHGIKEGQPVKLILVAETGTTSGISIESEVLTALIHLESALRIASILEMLNGAPFEYTYTQVLDAWQDPPVKVVEFTGQQQGSKLLPVRSSMANTSPGMMLQFAIAGLLVSAQILVNERKTHCLARMLTTSIRRSQILMGHFLAIFSLTICQFILLMGYGQFLLKVDYLWSPAAVGLVALSAAACIAGLGLLIGTFARTEEQAVAFSLVPMFVLVGLGGGWVPLEVVGPTFQVIGHLSPVAWAMDGFQNVVIRGQGLESALLPAAVLLGYAVLLYIVASWRFHKTS